MNFAIALALVDVLANAVHLVFLKPFKQRLVLIFWVNIFAYAVYLGLYFLKDALFEFHLHPVNYLAKECTLTNAPFYCMVAFCAVGSLALFNFLLDRYDVSVMIPVSESGILFISSGFVLLGNPFRWISLVSIGVIFLGAVISAYDKFSLSHPFAPLKKIPKQLVFYGLGCVLLASMGEWISFICTEKTPVTIAIQKWVGRIFSWAPVSFESSFEYNLGMRFFLIIGFLWYLIVIKKMGKDIVVVLKRNYWYVIGVAVLFTLSAVSHFAAFSLLENKTILTALGKLSIPIVLCLSAFLLSEKITQPKVIGCILIVLGGLLSLLG